MSQWNNSYTYNNQFQGPPNAWNTDINGQYVNQAYYGDRQFESNNQYVSFEEFLSQMQGNNVPQNDASNYNNIQYQTYSNNQYGYQNVPTQNTQIDFNYGPSTSNVSNNVDVYPVNVQNPFPVLSDPSYPNEVVINSKLTPTAIEFVPKSSMNIAATSSQNNVSHESTATNNSTTNGTKANNAKSSESNWRERPNTSNGESSNPHGDINNFSRFQKNFKNPEANNRNRNSNGRYSENNKRNNETNHDTNNHYRNTNSHTQNSNNSHSNHNRDIPSTSTQECDNQAIESQTYQNGRNYESGNRQHESKKYNNDEKHAKTNSKSNKNKDTDAGRTFYNSSINKSSQDVRNGRGENSGRQRNWPGSQRLRTAERNIVEDEQYANTYMHYKDERLERIAKTERTASPAKAKNRTIVDSRGMFYIHILISCCRC